MAERRMFAKTIVLSDAFLDLPLSSRVLYFTLGMFADDDGFVNSPKGIMRQAGCSEDDMKVLLAKKFLLAFDSGVIVIKHWRINNYLRSDRYVPTKYGDDKALLSIDENGAYTMTKEAGIPSIGIPSIGKDRIGKDSSDSMDHRKRFTAPTKEDVMAYCNERNNRVDPERFIDYYTANGWKVGKNPMKDWKAAVRTWERGEVNRMRSKKDNFRNYKESGDGVVKSLDDISADLDTEF